MIIFIYNNNVHVSINKILNKLLIKYIVNLKNAFKDRMLKREISFIIKRAK